MAGYGANGTLSAAEFLSTKKLSLATAETKLQGFAREAEERLSVIAALRAERASARTVHEDERLERRIEAEARAAKVATRNAELCQREEVEPARAALVDAERLIADDDVAGLSAKTAGVYARFVAAPSQTAARKLVESRKDLAAAAARRAELLDDRYAKPPAGFVDEEGHPDPLVVELLTGELRETVLAVARRFIPDHMWTQFVEELRDRTGGMIDRPGGGPREPVKRARDTAARDAARAEAGRRQQIEWVAADQSGGPLKARQLGEPLRSEALAEWHRRWDAARGEPEARKPRRRWRGDLVQS